MAVKVERAHQTVLPQDNFTRREMRTVEGFIDPKAILSNLEDDIRYGIFPLGDPETGPMDKKDIVPFEQRRLEEWGAKFQNGLLIPNNDLKKHHGLIGNTIQEIAINVAVGLAQKGILERVVNLGTLLTLRESPDYESARKAYALADSMVRAVAIAEAGFNPTMQTQERIRSRYAPFHAFLDERRRDAIPGKLFSQEQEDRAIAEEKAAVQENGQLIAQKVAAVRASK